VHGTEVAGWKNMLGSLARLRPTFDITRLNVRITGNSNSITGYIG
jgi:hypothetical protein